jgi:DNA-binding NarL/FixJ family response regulator
VIRAGLRAVLESVRDIQIVGEAATGLEAIDIVERTKPDVVLMDLSMPVLDGVEATRAIVATGSPSRVLVLTMHTEADCLASVMQAGASGYLLKSAAAHELATAIRALAYGDAFVASPPAALPRRQQAVEHRGESEREQFDHLTHREREIVRFVGQGYSAPEIGRRLRISPKTVDTYKHRIQQKLSLTHRSQYVQLALRLGLLAPG